MSRRRNGTNRAMAQLGMNRYKLGKKKRLGAATPSGAEEKIVERIISRFEGRCKYEGQN